MGEKDSFNQVLQALHEENALQVPPFVVKESPSQSHLLTRLKSVDELNEVEKKKTEFVSVFTDQLRQRLKPGVTLSAVVKPALNEALKRSSLDLKDPKIVEFVISKLKELGITNVL